LKLAICAGAAITGAAKNTIQKLTRELGEAVLAYQNNVLRNIPAKLIQCDEIWNYCYAKQKNLPDEMRGMPGVGDISRCTTLSHPADPTRVFIRRRAASATSQHTVVDRRELARRARVEVNRKRSCSACKPVAVCLDYQMQTRAVRGRRTHGSDTAR
jgi:hypothetical protein